MKLSNVLKFGGSSASFAFGSPETERSIESMSSLRTMISNAADEATIDLEGNTYMFTAADIVEGVYNTEEIRIADKSLTLQNGEIRGTVGLTNWTDEGSGVFSHDLPAPDLVINSCFWHLLDSNLPIENQPKPVVSTPLIGEYAETPFAYNDAWYTINDGDDVNNGSWTTDNGLSNGQLSTITITDPTLKSTVDGVLSQSFADGRYWVLLLAADKRLGRSPILDWDETTGVITLDETNSLKANANYLYFSIYGGSHNLSDGQYCMDASNNKIYYKPESGNPNGAELPIMPRCLYLNNISAAAYVHTLTLDNVSFHGFCPVSVTGGSFTSGGYIIRYPTDYNGPALSISECNFGYGDAAFGSMKGTLSDSSFYRFIDRGIIISEGDTVEGCSFIYVGDASSCISAREGIDDDPGRTMETTTIDGCFFNSPTSSHGQSIALYWATWQHSTVKNCVFLNHRAVTFNPSGSDPTDAGEMLIENNLSYSTVEYTPDPSLSIVQANSGGMDLHLTGQVVKLRNNAFISNLASSIANPNTKISRVSKQTTASLGNLTNSSIRSYNNLYGGILLDKDSGTESNGMESIGNGQVITSSNLAGFGVAFSSADLPFTDSYAYVQDNFIDYTDLAPQHVQGLVWDNIPTPTQLFAELENWTEARRWSAGINFGTPEDPVSADGTSNVVLDSTEGFDENDYRPPVTP